MANKSSKIPYPELPLPVKYRAIPRGAEISQPRVNNIIASNPPAIKMDVPELADDGLVPEPPTTQDHGDHVIEHLDFSDYQ